MASPSTHQLHGASSFHPAARRDPQALNPLQRLGKATGSPWQGEGARGSSELQLSVGDPIIQLKNDYTRQASSQGHVSQSVSQ